jgi:hypothetical protein
MKIMLGDYSAKAGKENTFTPTIGNESLLKSSGEVF